MVVAPSTGGPDLDPGEAEACPDTVPPDHNGNPQAAVSAGRNVASVSTDSRLPLPSLGSSPWGHWTV